MAGFYFDEMMSRAAAEQLKLRGIEVVMAVDVGMIEKDDLTEHLPYATERGMVLVTFDRKFAGIAMGQTDHAGVMCLPSGEQDNIDLIVRLLSQFADQHTPEDVKGRVFWLK